MFRSSMRSSSGSSLFTSLSMLLILKILKYLKSIVIHRGYGQNIFSMPVMRTVWRSEQCRVHTTLPPTRSDNYQNLY